MAEIKKINTELQPIDKLLDTSGDAGTSGQILSSTGSGTNWIANTGGGGTVTGTGVANRIAFWSDTSVLSSDADFYVDGDTIFTDNLNISSNLSIGGDIYKTSGNLTLDVAGDIKLSADGGDWYFQDGAANILVLTAGSNSSPTFAASQQDADIIFTGNDGGTTITALTLDMSDVGSAHFNNGLFIPNYIYHTGDTHTYFGFTGNDAFAMVFEGTTRLSVADSADPVFTMNAHLNMSTKDIDYVSQLHFADNVRWKDNGNDSDLNFVYGDTSVGHLRFVNGSAVYKGGIYAESGYFGTFSPDGSWAVQSSNSQTNITHKLEVQGNADLKADNVNLDWMHADADQVLRIEIDSGNDAYFSVTGNNDFYFRTNSTTALKIDGSQNSTFYGTGYFEGRVTIIPGYSGYDQIKIASNTTANTNKLSGIYTENYEGNNVSIFQTFTQDNNNTIYYGSADNNYAGMQNHRFYVNADSDTAGSGHTQALHIASDTNATFAGTLTVEGADAITIPDYILHAGDDSKFGFPSNDNFKIRLAGNDLFTMNTTTATFAGDLRISGSDLYLGTGSTSVNIKGYNDKTLIQGVSGATYMYGGNQTTLALTLQAGYAIAGSGFAYGAVNAYTKIIDGSTGAFTGTSGTFSSTLGVTGDLTLTAKATSAATVTGDGSTTLTTKGYVDGLITGATIYQGTWDANDGAGGNPDLTAGSAGTSPKINGYYYVVSVAGDATPNGPGTTPDDWHVGDWVIYNDHTGSSAWQKIDNSSVLSGTGTGQKVIKWAGSGTSDTIADGPITFSTSNNDSNFAGKIGIGMTPVELLDIVSASGDARIRLDSPTGSDTEIKFYNNGAVQYTIGHDDGTDDFVIGGTNVDAPLVSINKTGNVTIDITDSTAPGNLLTLYNQQNGGGASILFSDQAGSAQKGNITFYHSDGSSQGGGASFNLTSTEADLVLVVGDASYSGRIAVSSQLSVSEVDYGFRGDINTGMYRVADHQLGFAVNGSRKFYMSETKGYFQNLSSGVEINAGGIDVTGDSTFAGTIASGDITISDVNPNLTLSDTSTTDLIHEIKSSSDKLQISADTNNVVGSTKIEFLIDGTEVLDLSSSVATFAGDIRREYNASNYLDIGYDSINVVGGDLLLKRDGTEKFRIGSTSATFAGDISIPVAKKLYFGGGSHTYIGEDIDDRLRFFTGGAEFMRFTEDTADTVHFFVKTIIEDDLEVDGDVAVNGGRITITESGTNNDLLVMNASSDVYADQVWADSGGSIRLRSHNGAFKIYTGGDANSLSANGSTNGFTLSTTQNATFSGDVLIPSGYVGRDSHNRIDFQTDNNIFFRVADSYRAKFTTDYFSPYADKGYDLGASSLYWDDAYIDTLYSNGHIMTGWPSSGSGSLQKRTYSFTTADAGGSFLLGQIEDSADTDGAIDGTVHFAYDYGTTTNNCTLHFNFAQRSGTARGTWWYENDDQDAAADRVHVKLIDNGSGGMFVWVIAVDYSKCVVDTTWLDGNNIVASGVLSSGTVTTGTTLFDTANDPTAEMHIGGLEAHGNATFAGNVTIDGSNGSNGIDLLRPTDSAIMQAISAPDSSTLKIGGGNQSYVKIYAHTTEVVEFNNSGNATFVGNIAISGGSKSFSFTSGSGTVKTTTGNSLILQTNSSDGIVIDGSTQNVTIANDLALTGGALSISGDGSNAVTFTESSAGIMTIATPDDFVVDAEGDIAFDANGGDIRLKDGGTQWGSLYTGGGGTHMYIESAISDKDIIFKGNDGGSTITALTLDMSVGGSAFFNHDIVMPDNGKVTFGTGSDLQIYHDASNSYIVDTDVGSLKICAANFHVMNAGATEYMMTGTPDEGVILYYNGSVKFKTTDEGIQIADSNLYLKDGSNIRLETTITTNSDSSGTIINFGGTSVTAGYYYVLNSSSGWEDTQADAEEFSKGLIAVARATGTASSVGMLLEGIYRDASHGFTIGAPLFLSADDNNLVTTTAPSGSSEVVRVMGYAIDANHIYFKPDPTWVVLD